jgi:phosphoglycerate dehydrogenase-like enzyme
MLRRPAADELAARLADADVLISERSVPVTGDMIAAAPRLRLIVRLGSLWHDIDAAAAKARGVRVSVQPVTGCVYGAEHVLMMTLAVLKRLGRSLHAATEAGHGREPARTDEDTFAYNWLNYSDLRGLQGKTVAILGMGEIGVETARRLRAFGPARILYNKRTPYPPAVERDLGAAWADREDCLSAADVLVSLLPYSPETDRSLDADTFGRMKPGACVVHVGSGSVIDEAALLDALRSGHLAGAALDTFEWEPLEPVHPLVTYACDPDSNLLLTPHVAVAAEPGSYAGDFDEVRRFLAGEPLRHEV